MTTPYIPGPPLVNDYNLVAKFRSPYAIAISSGCSGEYTARVYGDYCYFCGALDLEAPLVTLYDRTPSTVTSTDEACCEHCLTLLPTHVIATAYRSR